MVLYIGKYKREDFKKGLKGIARSLGADSLLQRLFSAWPINGRKPLTKGEIAVALWRNGIADEDGHMSPYLAEDAINKGISYHSGSGRNTVHEYIDFRKVTGEPGEKRYLPCYDGRARKFP